MIYYSFAIKFVSNNDPQRLVYTLYNWRNLLAFYAKGVTGSMAYDIMLAVVVLTG